MLDARDRRLLDVIAVVWTALWVLGGYTVYDQVLRLRELSDTVVVAGVQLQQSAKTLRTFRNLPFVGGDIEKVARNAESAARSAKRSGRESRDSVHDVAVLLGLAVGAVAIAPALLAWALLRFRRPVHAP
jgi:uncharacterized membrane protein YoaK (UPF0700 family)